LRRGENTKGPRGREKKRVFTKALAEETFGAFQMQRNRKLKKEGSSILIEAEPLRAPALERGEVRARAPYEGESSTNRRKKDIFTPNPPTRIPANHRVTKKKEEETEN